MQPEESGGRPDPARSNVRDGRDRLTVIALAVLSALFFTVALAYGLGSGLLIGGGDGEREAADRDGRKLPREWATMIPLRPLGPELDSDPDASEAAGAREDSTGSERDAPAGASARPTALAPAAARPAVVRAPRVRPAVVLTLPRRAPILSRVVRRRLPDLVDLTPSDRDLPDLPDPDDVDLVPDIDVLPGGVRIPPILPGGVQIPPILPGGVQIPPIDPFPGGVSNPPIDPVPGGGLPFPGGGLPLPSGPLGTLPPPVLLSVASFEPLDAIARRREAGDLDRATDQALGTGRSATAAERAGDRDRRGGDTAGKSLRADRGAERRSAGPVTVARASAGPSGPGDRRQPKREGSRSSAPNTAEPQQQRGGSEPCPDRPGEPVVSEDAPQDCGEQTEAGESTDAPTDPDGDREEIDDSRAGSTPRREQRPARRSQARNLRAEPPSRLSSLP